jgi:hypothetical protein
MVYRPDSAPVRLYDNIRYGTFKNFGGPFVATFERKATVDCGGLKNGDAIPLAAAEKAANFGLWLLEEFPKKVWKWIHEPRFVTVTLTLLALGANSALFYPKYTQEYLRQALKQIPIPPPWTVRLSAYLITSQWIVSYGVRALSRFNNVPLRKAYYGASHDAIFG